MATKPPDGDEPEAPYRGDWLDEIARQMRRRERERVLRVPPDPPYMRPPPRGADWMNRMEHQYAEEVRLGLRSKDQRWVDVRAWDWREVERVAREAQQRARTPRTSTGPAGLLTAVSTVRLSQVTGDVDVARATFTVSTYSSAEGKNLPRPPDEPWQNRYQTEGYYTGGKDTPGLTTRYYQVDGADGHVALEVPTTPEGKKGLLWLCVDLGRPLGIANWQEIGTGPRAFPDVVGWSTDPEAAKKGKLAIKFFTTAKPTVKSQPPCLYDNPAHKGNKGQYTLIVTSEGYDFNGGNNPYCGITVNGKIYIGAILLNPGGVGGINYNQESALFEFDPIALTFTYIRTLSLTPSVDTTGSYTGAFVRTAFCLDADGEHVLMFGTGALGAPHGPKDPPVQSLFLARTPLSEFGSTSATIEYFNGSGFKGTSELQAVPANTPSGTLPLPYYGGDISVQPVKGLGWLLLFNNGYMEPDGTPGTQVQFCWARKPEGPWSNPATLFQVTEGQEPPPGVPFISDSHIFMKGTQAFHTQCTNGLCGPAIPIVLPTGKPNPHAFTGKVYRPAIIPGFTEVDTVGPNLLLVTLWWTVSTGVPYYGQLMKSQFQFQAP